MSTTKTYNASIMFLLTPQQRRFLQLFAKSKQKSVSKILRAFINSLMKQNPDLAKQAAEYVEKGW